MKSIKLNALCIILLALTYITSCKKEELNPYVKGLPGVYGRGEVAGTFKNLNDTGVSVKFKLKWIDVNRVVSIKTYSINIQYTRNYLDTNGNEQVADLGIVKLKVDLPAKENNVYDSFNITPNQVYELYKSATFKFDQKNLTNVFSGAKARNGSRFDLDDHFKLTWSFKDNNNNEYKWWSVSVANQELYSGAKDINGNSIQSNTAVSWDVE